MKKIYKWGHDAVLVLGRNLGDTIVINDNIFIKICKGKSDDFKIAIHAPKDVKIVRGEMVEEETKKIFRKV